MTTSVAGVAPACSAAALSFVLVPMVARFARRFAIVDRPGGHHGNGRAVPILGGVAIAASVGLTLAIAGWFEGSLLRPLAEHGAGVLWVATACLLILLLGVVDDVVGVGPLAKLAVQTTVASLVLTAGYGFAAVTNPLTGGHIELGWLGPLATVVWIVAITNAFNLIDGLDGLAAGVALIATLTLLGIALLEGRDDAVLVWAVLAGSLIGFLPYNFPPASIFLGDCGSLFLGFAVAVLSIQSLQKGAATVVLAVPILALGLPIVDASYAIARRWLVSGVAAIVRADRDHIHHRLQRSGFTDRGAVLVLYACCSAFSAFAFLAVVARGPLQGVLVALAACGAYLATRMLDRGDRSRNRRDDRQ